METIDEKVINSTAESRPVVLDNSSSDYIPLELESPAEEFEPNYSVERPDQMIQGRENDPVRSMQSPCGCALYCGKS